MRLLLAPGIALGLCGLSSAQSGDGVEKKNATSVEEFEILRSYPLSHCIAKECWPRGTLQLGRKGARIDDDKVFEKMRDFDADTLEDSSTTKVVSLRQKLAVAPIGSFYTLKVTTLDEEDSKKSLETSIPVHLIRNTEDLHDSLEVSLSIAARSDDKDEEDPGSLIGVNYRFTKAWGLNLFEHTTVRLLRSQLAPEIKLPSRPVPKQSPQKESRFNADGTVDPTVATDSDETTPPGVMGMLRKYWWVILAGILVAQLLAPPEAEEAAPAKKAVKKSQ